MEDGLEVALTDGKDYGNTWSIGVAGADVYVAGTKDGGYTNSVWKNGTLSPMTNNQEPQGFFSVATSGNDVYVAGYKSGHNSDGHLDLVATYWRNGIPVTLPHGRIATSIVVSGKDIYAAGNGYSSYPGWRYWKNSIETILADQSSLQYISSMAVSGNDVYIVGKVIEIGGYQGGQTVYKAKLWKNGFVESFLTGGSINLDYVTPVAIAVSGNDVFVAAGVAYWKNGIVHFLPDENDSVVSVASVGNDLYLTGYGVSDGRRVAKYWKNGVPVILSKEGEDTATSIFIVK